MNEKLQAALKDPRTIVGVTGVVAFVGGATLGYILGRRSVMFGVHEIPEPQLSMDIEDLPQMRPGRVIIDEDALREIDDASEVLTNGEAFVTQRIHEEVVEEDVDEEALVVRQSVFANTDDDWNLEEEMKKRRPSEPYVIHKDEFYADEMGFSQLTLTYYAGDEIVVDIEDKPVYNHKQVIGEFHWGHGSGEPTVFYVRNEARKAEYEVILNEGLYSVEVLGLEIEENERAQDIKHFNTPRFRQD